MIPPDEDRSKSARPPSSRRGYFAALLLAGWLLPSIVFAGTCPPACGTPASGGEFPRGADCLFILRTSVGTVITQAKAGPACDDYRRLLDAETKPHLAKQTLARKIAAAVLRMWKDEKVYRPDRVIKEKSESNSPVQAVV